MESHYMREKSKRQFSASNLNIHSVYELYQSEKEIEVEVGGQTYRNVFNTCFNLSFHKPEKDCCETCIEFENATPQQKTLLEENYCLAFDLQKVLNVPSGENGLFYYTRKLVV